MVERYVLIMCSATLSGESGPMLWSESRCGSSSVREGSASIPPCDLHDLGLHDRGRRRDRAPLGLGKQLSCDYQRPLPPSPRTNPGDQLLS